MFLLPYIFQCMIEHTLSIFLMIDIQLISSLSLPTSLSSHLSLLTHAHAHTHTHTITNNSATSILVHGAHVQEFFWNLGGTYIFSFAKYYQTIFLNGCNNLPSTINAQEFPLSIPKPPFDSGWLFTFAIRQAWNGISLC